MAVPMSGECLELNRNTGRTISDADILKFLSDDNYAKDLICIGCLALCPNNRAHVNQVTHEQLKKNTAIKILDIPGLLT